MADILIDNQSLPTTPSTGKSVLYVDSTTKKSAQLDDAGAVHGMPLSRSYSTASQGPGFAVDTYVTSSGILVPSCGIQAGSVFRWYITLSKTAAGTAATVLTFRLGAAQTTADTSLLALTATVAQSAAVDEGVLIVSLGCRTTGATGVVAGGFGFASAAGLGGGKDGVSGAVDISAAAGKYLGLSINGGAAAAWTITSVTAEMLG